MMSFVNRVKEALDRANPNTIADMYRKVKIGTVLAGHMPQHVRMFNMDEAGANAGNLATVDAMQLPDFSRAAVILRAFSRAGGVTGELTVAAPGATPLTGQIAVAANGNIVTLETDAITSLDVLYVPEAGEVVESVFPVVSNAIALPGNFTERGVIAVLEAEVVEGTATGNKIVLAAAGAPAAGQAALNADKTSVVFNATDAGTRARVKLLVAVRPKDQLQNVLASPQYTTE